MTEAVEVTVRRIGELGIIPVVEINDAALSVPLVGALVRAGLACAEITLRTDAALSALERVRDAYPDVLLGAGTVLRRSEVGAANAAGARFVVTPGVDTDVVDECLARGIPVYPGVCTPTEVQMVLARGLRVVKFFPAEAAGGIPYLKALAAVYRDVQFIPTGGIDSANVADYLRLPRVIACGGSWLVRPELVTAGEFETIERLAVEAVAIVADVRAAASIPPI